MKIEKNLKNYVSNVSSSGRNTRWKEVYPVRRTGFAFRGWIRIRIARGEPYNLLIKYLADGWKRDLPKGGRREGVYGGSFSFRVICGSLAVRIDAASRPITIHRTTITPLGYIVTRATVSYALFPSLKAHGGRGIGEWTRALTLSSALLIRRYILL